MPDDAYMSSFEDDPTFSLTTPSACASKDKRSANTGQKDTNRITNMGTSQNKETRWSGLSYGMIRGCDSAGMIRGMTQGCGSEILGCPSGHFLHIFTTI